MANAPASKSATNPSNKPTKAAEGTATYIWHGIDSAGKKVNGELNAGSVAAVKTLLRKQGINPQKVQKKTVSIFANFSNKITNKETTYFTRQLATMLKAGIPLVQAFTIISKGMENKKLQDLTNQIRSDLEAGQTLYEAFSKYPKYFNELYCNLVLSGEQAGALDSILDRLATYKERTETIKGKIKKAMFYPIAVVVVAIVVTIALLIYVVPQFESIFKSFNAELPYLTQVVIGLSKFMQSYWWVIIGAIVGSVWFLIYLKKNSKRFSELMDKVTLKLPIIGGILRKAAIARFARTLSTTFAAGVPMVDGLQSVAKATGNSLYNVATEKMTIDIAKGQQLNSAMRSCGLFPEMVLQMVTIGEESGTLEEMLGKVADFYEEEVNNAVDSMSSLIEPLIMVVLGGLVGTLLIAMYLPIFKLGSVI